MFYFCNLMSVRHTAKILNFNKGSFREEAPVSSVTETAGNTVLVNTREHILLIKNQKNSTMNKVLT